MEDLIGKNTKFRIPGEKTKVFLHKTYKMVSVCQYWCDTKAPFTHVPSLSLIMRGSSEQNTKNNYFRTLKSKPK